MPQDVQRLDLFRMPADYRGASPLRLQLWRLVQGSLFRWSPQVAYGWRAFLLRRFGARIGRGVLIRPTVEVAFPWKLEIGDYAWIGDDVALYAQGPMRIGAHAVVSQRCYLCGGDHDYTKVEFTVRSAEIRIGEQAWLAADVFVAPGVEIGERSVIGARSSVFSNQPPDMVCYGYPCRPRKPRKGPISENIDLQPELRTGIDRDR